EEGRVEEVRAFDDAPCLHVARVRRVDAGIELRVLEEPDALDARADVRPELADARGAREPAGHAYDSDAVATACALPLGARTHVRRGSRRYVTLAERTGEPAHRRVLEERDDGHGAAELAP